MGEALLVAGLEKDKPEQIVCYLACAAGLESQG
jgi:hypothetical protein